MFGGTCSPLAEPSRVADYSSFLVGFPRIPTTERLSWGPAKSPLAAACFSYLFGSKSVEENLKPVTQWPTGSNAGVRSGRKGQTCPGSDDSGEVCISISRMYLHRSKTMITFQKIRQRKPNSFLRWLWGGEIWGHCFLISLKFSILQRRKKRSPQKKKKLLYLVFFRLHFRCSLRGRYAQRGQEREWRQERVMCKKVEVEVTKLNPRLLRSNFPEGKSGWHNGELTPARHSLIPRPLEGRMPCEQIPESQRHSDKDT